MGKVRDTLASIVRATGVEPLEADYFEQGACHLVMHDAGGINGWKLSALVESLCSPDESEGSLTFKGKLTLRFYAANSWKDSPRVRDVVEHMGRVLMVFKGEPTKRRAESPALVSDAPALVSDGKRVKTEREQRLEQLLWRLVRNGSATADPGLTALRADVLRELDP